MLPVISCPNRLKKYLFFVPALLLATGAAHAGLSVTFSKAFAPDTIGPGSTTTLTFTITNSDPVNPVSDLAFTDTLPAGVTIATPANSTNACGGTLAAPEGGGIVTFSDGGIAAGGTCTIAVNVTSSTVGTHTNTTGILTSSAGNGGTATADLIVATDRPGFTKSFAPSSVPFGSRSTLTFTIDNTLNGSQAIFLTFSDVLPSGMEIAGPANNSNTCSEGSFLGGVVVAVPGTNVVSLTSGGGFDIAAVDSGASCMVSVDVTGTGSGMLGNVSEELTAEVSGILRSCGKASGVLEVTATSIALSKSFTDDPVPPGGTVNLDFIVNNFERLNSATGIAFSDDLTTVLAGLTFSSLLANDCGGSVSGIGTTDINFAGGTLAPETSCTISTSLTVPLGSAPGTYTNTTGAVTATVGGSPVTGNIASDDLFVAPIPILTKEFLDATTLLPDPIIDAGDDVVMRFSIDNTSVTSGAADIAFIDDLTAFLPFPISVVLPATPCGAGSSISVISLGTDRQGLSLIDGSLIAPPGAGSSCTFDVTLTVPVGVAPGVYVNTTDVITATVDGANQVGEPARDDFVVIGAPSLAKAFTDDPVVPGGTVELEFTLTHRQDAPTAATGITFTDDLTTVLAGLTANLPATPDPPCGAGSTLTGSAGDTLLTLQGGTLLPGESCTFSVTLDVPVGAAPGNHTNTTSGVGASVAGLATTSRPATDDLQVAGLTFAKEFIGDPVVPGEIVTLRFTIENVHPTDDASSITFTDNLNDVLQAPQISQW